jgi:hypothetical protein
MALPSSGTISLNDLQTEFGGSNPIAISEYYRGGGLVPDVAVNANVPTSGQISLSNFYGASNSDPNPAPFAFGDISDNFGTDTFAANSNQVTITGINVPITMNFGMTDGEVNRTGLGFGPMSGTVTVYVDGVFANSFTWSRGTNGQTQNITRNMKVTVSNNANLIVGIAGGLGGDEGDTGGWSGNITITNDSSANAALDTFGVSGACQIL